MRPVAEKAPNALDRLGDRLEAVGVGEPDIILAERAKAGAGDRRHPFFVEQPALESAGVVPGPGNVGEGVEGTARLGAADPGKPVERRGDHLAALGECLDHAVDRLTRAFERGDPGILRRRVDAGMAVDREPLGVGENRLWPYT